MSQPLNGGGSIALHVRLASVTELMGSPAESDHLKLVLRTPAGDFDPVARPPALRGSVTLGPEVMAGWRPCLVVDRETILRPFHDARVVLFFASALAGGTISLLLFRMAWRLQQRVDVLSEGTKLVAAGRFGHRVEISGNDEIADLGRRFNRMAERLGRLVDRTVRMRRQAALGQFSTGIAHEVRNPLAALKTTVQAMARLERDPQRAALLADMEREVDRMARAMTAILTFGRPRPPVRMDVPVDEEVRQILQLAEQGAAERAIQLVRGEGLECSVAVDPDHLRQILMNLVANALQATPAGGRVTVQGRARADVLEIEVEDTGEGIAPDKLAQVFEPFYTTKPGGTGLGLAISRQLAEMNDGELSLRSTVGGGTTATLTLPRGPAHHADHPHHR
jgi:two-component system sensor histidine kinase AtoS